jgi:hypothetical protein
MGTENKATHVPSSLEPQEHPNSSAPSKDTQRSNSMQADVSGASSDLPKLASTDANVASSSQQATMAPAKVSCGVVNDAVMELHMREGESMANCCLHSCEARVHNPPLLSSWLACNAMPFSNIGCI